MQYLIGVRVADAAENVRVGERALQRVIGPAERGSERFAADLQRLDSTGVQRVQSRFTLNHVERSAALRSRFRQPEPSVVELERGEHVSAAHLWCAGAPMQPAGDF